MLSSSRLYLAKEKTIVCKQLLIRDVHSRHRRKVSNAQWQAIGYAL